MEEFDRAWKAWLKGRRLQKRSGLLAQKLRFRKAAPGKRPRKEGDEEDDSPEVLDPRARNFARLGGMLRARRRLQAAAIEYEKALALLSPGHPVIAGKLSRTYLELGEVDRAIAVAEPARELYPDLPGPNVTLGGAWLKKGDMTKAATFLEAAIRVNPFDPQIHCGLERAYKELGSPLSERAAQACRVLSGG
jgi:predicted Zn-dependent protease